MELKGLRCVRSRVNGSVYYGEVVIDEKHVIFVVVGNVVDNVKIYEVTKIVDINGDVIDDVNIEREILRGF